MHADYLNIYHSIFSFQQRTEIIFIMETELVPAIRGNVQLLRTIWNSRIEKDQPPSSRLIHSQRRISDYKQFLIAPNPTIITDDDVEDTSNVFSLLISIFSLFEFRFRSYFSNTFTQRTNRYVKRIHSNHR